MRLFPVGLRSPAPPFRTAQKEPHEGAVALTLPGAEAVRPGPQAGCSPGLESLYLKAEGARGPSGEDGVS